MHRFYCPGADFSSKHICITDKSELHHLRDVLRLKKNDRVYLFDGKGAEAAGSLRAVTSRKADVQIQTVTQFERKKPLIILACALPKKSKFEFIIEKAAELGADEIIPLRTLRTEIRLKGGRLDKKNLRYQTVAVNAAKQSRRAVVPAVHPVTDFPAALDRLAKTTVPFIPSLSGERENLLAAFRDAGSPAAVSFLIGPEGDFTPEEYALAREHGCIPVTLGETVLRVETAAICSLACAGLFFAQKDRPAVRIH